MMFEEGITIIIDEEEIRIPAIKVWSCREYIGGGPYQTQVHIGTPCTPFHNAPFYSRETKEKKGMVDQHFDVVNYFQQMYLSQEKDLKIWGVCVEKKLH